VKNLQIRLIAFLILLFPLLSRAQQVDVWLPIGPTVLAGDTMYSIVVNPNSADTIYAGGLHSRFYRTYNGGTNWTPTGTFPGDYKIVDLIIHPVNTNTIIAATDTGGVFISTNRGDSWTQTVTGMTDLWLNQLLLNPAQTSTLFAVGRYGVYKSTNLGTTWASRNDGLYADSVNVTTIGSTRIEPYTIYVGTTNGRIYRSDNNGISWGLRGTIAGASITSIIVDNTDPDILYIGTANHGVRRSIDGGITMLQYPSNYPPTDSLRVLSMALDTSSTRKLYVGTNGNGVFTVEIDGPRLTAINQGLNNGKIYDLAINPSAPYIIYASTFESAFNNVYKYIGNRKPIITSIGRVQANAGEQVTFTLSATDPDFGETAILVYNVSQLPSTATFDSLATHVFRWIPAATDTGNHSIIFTVHDQRSGYDVDTVIVNVNRIPVLTIDNLTITGREDSTITFSVIGTDADGDSLVFGIVNSPSGATFIKTSTNNYQFTWTPNYDQAGSYAIGFTVSDGRTGVALKTVNIAVANKNRAPYFDPVIPDKTVSEGNLLSFTVKGTDSDGDPITYGKIGSLPTGAGFDSLDTKRFSWIPTYSDSGRYTIVLTLRDFYGAATIDSIVITVVNVNRSPVITNLPDTIYVNEGDSISRVLTATDADNDSIWFDAANLPLGSSLNRTTGKFYWIPNFSQEGTYRVTFTVIDRYNGSTYKYVYVIVNQKPYWNPVTGKSTQEGVLLTFVLSARDDDRDSLRFTVQNLPANAQITYPARDSIRFTWTPQKGQAGMYAVTFIASDGRGGIDQVIIPIQVTSSTGQLPPVIVPVPDKSTNEGQLVIFQIVATDDGPQDSLRFGTIGAIPAGAAFDSSNTHIFQWTPSYFQSGVYSLIFYVRDSYANVTRDTVIITVRNVNRNPVTTLPSDTSFSEGTVISLPVGVSDPDGEIVSIIYFEVPFGAVIDSTGAHRLIWTPLYLSAGSYRLRFTATDPSGGILQHTLRITITNTNRNPQVFNIIYPTLGQEIKLTDYLIWERSQDLDIDDSISYQLEIDNNFNFTSVDIRLDTVNNIKIVPGYKIASFTINSAVLSKSGGGEAFVLKVSDIPGITTLKDDSLYYWRVRAFDNHGGQSPYTANIYSFHLNLVNDPPQPTIAGFTPGSGATVSITQPIFRWDSAKDPDYSDTPENLRYAVELSKDNFTSGSVFRIITNFGTNTFQSPLSFRDNELWYYRIKTFDDDGDSSSFSAVQQFYVNTIPEPPIAFNLLSPVNNYGYITRPDSIRFDWSNSFDPDPGNLFIYRLEISKDNTFSPASIILYKDSISNAISQYTISANTLERATYYWRVIAKSQDNFSVISNQVWMFGLITDIGDKNNRAIPTKFTVEKNYPNPFNNQTIIKYGVPYTTDVHITIYSGTGQIVYKDYISSVGPGYHTFIWNGISSSGDALSSGMYFLMITTKKDVHSQRILLIK